MRLSFHWPKAHQISQLDLPETSMNTPVSISQLLPPCPALLFDLWESNSNPIDCKAGSFPFALYSQCPQFCKRISENDKLLVRLINKTVRRHKYKNRSCHVIIALMWRGMRIRNPRRRFFGIEFTVVWLFLGTHEHREKKEPYLSLA